MSCACVRTCVRVVVIICTNRIFSDCVNKRLLQSCDNVDDWQPVNKIYTKNLRCSGWIVLEGYVLLWSSPDRFVVHICWWWYNSIAPIEDRPWIKYKVLPKAREIRREKQTVGTNTKWVTVVCYELQITRRPRFSTSQAVCNWLVL